MSSSEFIEAVKEDNGQKVEVWILM